MRLKPVIMMKKLTLIVLIIGVVAALAGCSLPGNANESATQTAAAMPSPSLSPTRTLPPPVLTPTPTLTATVVAPTEIPAPTQIMPGTMAPDTTGTPGTPGAPASTSGPGIVMNPAVGEPLDAVIVNGSGFPPNTHVTLHWGPVGGPHGPVYWELDADASGSFTIDLRIPPAEKWPGGAPKERDLLQLQARWVVDGAESFVYHNFTYVKRFNPQTSLVLTYSNQTYGYKLDIPNNWKWDDASAANVRFTAPTGSAKGFVRTLDGTDVNAAIQTVMAAEAPGQAFTSNSAATGAYNGTQVTAANGLMVWFIASGGRIYALNFVDGNGQFFTTIAATFRLG